MEVEYCSTAFSTAVTGGAGTLLGKTLLREEHAQGSGMRLEHYCHRKCMKDIRRYTGETVHKLKIGDQTRSEQA